MTLVALCGIELGSRTVARGEVFEVDDDSGKGLIARGHAAAEPRKRAAPKKAKTKPAAQEPDEG